MTTLLKRLALVAGLISTLNPEFATCLAQGTAFTYQGRLNDAAGPVNGPTDYEFRLFNAGTGGAQVGSLVTVDDVSVNNGLFTVTLDFGAGAFDGSARWLAIAVRPGASVAAYTNLLPRQSITGTPYAIRAASAASAGTAQNVVGPVPASQITGTISSANLPPINNGAPLAPGGVVMSDDPANAALAAQGFARVPNAEMMLTAEKWTKANPPSANAEFIKESPSEISVSTGSELLVFRFGGSVVGGRVSEDLVEALIFNPISRQWRKAAVPPAGVVGPGATAIWTGSQAVLWGGRRPAGEMPDEDGVLRTIYEFPGGTLLYSPISNQWSVVSTLRPPQGRTDHAAVWTGSKMLIWGGESRQYTYRRINFGFGYEDHLITTTVLQDNGAAFDPLTGSWTSMNTNGAPSHRYGAVVAWAGDRMIVQGGTAVPFLEWLGWLLSGSSNDVLRDGFSYDPRHDTWSPIRSDSSAPSYAYAKAVWTGSELFVYGGATPRLFPDSGEILVSIRDAYSYDPASDTWTARGNPDAAGLGWGGRRDFAMVWTGTDVIAWGGLGFNDSLAYAYPRRDGHAFSFTDNKWRSIADASLVLERALDPQAGWGGNQMAIFGASNLVADFVGLDYIDHDNRTGSYSPASNSWRSEANYFGLPPLNPVNPTVVWTGTEFILWGGLDNGVVSNRGLRYNPTTGLWTELSTANAPAARTRHSAVWTGTRMVVWGGDSGGDPIYPAVVHAGGQLNDIFTNSSFSSIGSGYDNNISINSESATIAGGVANDIGENSDYSVIGGGNDNDIANNSASTTIAGGISNDVGVNSFFSSIGGGSDNNIGGGSVGATIAGGVSNDTGTGTGYSANGGGYENTIPVNAQFATIPGGTFNFATNHAFAAGRRAKASHTGAFVWGDSTNADISSTNANSVTLRAAGGYRLFSGSGATAGVFLAAGETAWSVLSDRNLKKDVAAVDSLAVLETLATLPIARWRYQWEAADATPHLGPMAQDFKAAFYPGRDDRSITTQEADGVALAAIQGLNEKLEGGKRTAEHRMEKLEAENAELRNELNTIKALLERLTHTKE